MSSISNTCVGGTGGEAGDGGGMEQVKGGWRSCRRKGVTFGGETKERRKSCWGNEEIGGKC